MSHRTFKAAVAEAGGEPITFEVEGYDHTFTVAQPLPVGQLLKFASLVKNASGEDVSEEQGVEMGAGFYELLAGWLIKEDRPKWDECLGQMSDLSMLGEIVTYIIEEVTARPTQAY